MLHIERGDDILAALLYYNYVKAMRLSKVHQHPSSQSEFSDHPVNGMNIIFTVDDIAIYFGGR